MVIWIMFRGVGEFSRLVIVGGDDEMNMENVCYELLSNDSE